MVYDNGARRDGREEYKARPKLVSLDIYRQFASTCKPRRIYVASLCAQKFYALFTLKQQIYVGEGEELHREDSREAINVNQ